MKPQNQIHVLHLDDDPFELDRVKAALSEGHQIANVAFQIDSAQDAAAYLKKLKHKTTPDVVLLDIDIGDQSKEGINLAKQTREQLPDVTILMLSSYDDAATITKCLNLGADDFVSKKSDKGELNLRIYHSYTLAKFKRSQNLNPTTLKTSSSAGFAGGTIEQFSTRIPNILRSAVTTVHIHGETGTGKEVVADLFGKYLPKAQPFIKINCGAIAPTLMESELFGRVKGAYTGALNDRRGLIESANGGWVFLDEVANLSTNAQGALLRAIENQEIIRVGDNTPRKISVKFLSATNEPLEELVKQGRFRKDLWQRLCELEIQLPPLRERIGEIEPMIKYFLKTMPGGPYEISPPTLEVLCSAPWRQGNIRELRNCLRAMTEFHVDKVLTPLSIPKRFWEELETKEKELKQDVEEPIRGNVSLTVRTEDNLNYDYLSDLLLLELTKLHAKKHGKISLRSLAKSISVSRSTLSTRLRNLVERNIIDLESLSKLVGISDKA